jgi:hypothetical protein
MPRSSQPLWNLIELNYFRRLPLFRAAKRWATIGCAVIAAGCVAMFAVREDESLYSSGAMSRAHRLIAADCFKCHVEPWRGLKAIASTSATDHSMNRGCLACHAGTIGHERTTYAAWHVTDGARADASEPMASCQSCHTEHKGSASLTNVSDVHCTSCHSDLKGTHPETRFAARISSFEHDHPEFRLISEENADRAAIKLNHQVHLRPNLAGPNRQPVQMACADCHRAGGVAGYWPYGEPGLHENAGATGYALGGAYMQPIRYSLHCKDCHQLKVYSDDARLPGGTIPHDTPEMIRVYLRGRLAEYINKHPNEALEQQGRRWDDRPSNRPPPKELERLKSEWIEQEIGAVEQMVYLDRKDCLLCHVQEWQADEPERQSESLAAPPRPSIAASLPRIVPPNIPDRWFQHASFDHERHRLIDCRACHVGVTESTVTADVLLPGVDLCRTCHAAGSTTSLFAEAGAARDCVVCHTYHRPPPVDSTVPGMALDQLTATLRIKESSP